MNSWSRLCWPILMSTRSSSRNFCWYHSSHSRVARSASMPLAVCSVQQIVGAEVAAVDLQRAGVEQCRRTSRRPAACRAAAPSASARHIRSLVLTPPVTLPSTSLVSGSASEMPYWAEQGAQAPHVAEQVAAARVCRSENPNGPAAGSSAERLLTPGTAAAAVRRRPSPARRAQKPVAATAAKRKGAGKRSVSSRRRSPRAAMAALA